MKKFINAVVVLVLCFMQLEAAHSEQIDQSFVVVLADIISKQHLAINDDDITSTWRVKFRILKTVQGKTNLKVLTIEVIGTRLPQSNLMLIVFRKINMKIEIVKYIPVHRIVCIEDSSDLDVVEIPHIDDSTCNRIID